MADTQARFSSNTALCAIIPPDILDHISKSDKVSKKCRDKASNTLNHAQTVHRTRQSIQAHNAKHPAKQATRKAAAQGPRESHLDRTLYDCKGKGGLPIDFFPRDGKIDAHSAYPENLQDLPEWKGTKLFAEGHKPTASDDASAVNVYNQFKLTYDFYREVFGRDSIDGQGLPLVGCVHYDEVTDPDPGFFNAFFWLDVMAYGDGDNEIFRSFTDIIDITGHELTHGVTAATAGLPYKNQAGALNESLSDVFGSMVKQWSHSPQQTAATADWLIGRGLFLIPDARALRDMANPGTAHGNTGITGGDRQPRDMDGYVELYPPVDGRGGNDNGGVHLYSGIPNRAFYLVATTLGGYAWEKAGKIWYDTMNDDGLKIDENDSNATRTAFKIFADLTVKHAEQFGDDAVKAVTDAWTNVKVYPWKTNWRTRAPAAADEAPKDGAAKSEL